MRKFFKWLGVALGSLAGTSFLDDPMLGVVPAPNLTSGAGGTGSEFTMMTGYVPSVMALTPAANL